MSVDQGGGHGLLLTCLIPSRHLPDHPILA
jgi:hypothetical protein